MPQIKRAQVNEAAFNRNLALPYNLRISDFRAAIEDVYDFFGDVNEHLTGRGLTRLEDMLRPANLSGTLSDMLTESIGKHSRSLTPNLYHNGHPDLVVRDRYPDNKAKAGEEGVEVKTTRKPGGAVDMHGARNQTLCTIVYDIDNDQSKGVFDREPLRIREIYVATVTEADFRKNNRGELGTRTATLDREGIKKFREGWLYMDYPPSVTDRMRRAQPWRQGPAGSKSTRGTRNTSRDPFAFITQQFETIPDQVEGVPVTRDDFLVMDVAAGSGYYTLLQTAVDRILKSRPVDVIFTNPPYRRL